MAQKLTVDLSGPFFQRDPGLTLRGNIERMMEGLAEEGERLVRTDLGRGEGQRYPLGLGLGRVRQHAIGRVRSLQGKKWRASAVISVNNSGLTQKQGIKLMAAASYLESRLHSFRRTSSAVRRARAVVTANLAAGLE